MAQDKPSNVRVRMKVGEIEFDIECTPNELRSVVDTVLAAIAEKGVNVAVAGKAESLVESKQYQAET